MHYNYIEKLDSPVTLCLGRVSKTKSYVTAKKKKNTEVIAKKKKFLNIQSNEKVTYCH